MKIEVIGRHAHNSKEVRDYAEQKAKKVLKYFKKITKVEVVLDTEKDQQAAKMTISVNRGTQLVGNVVHADIHAAIDLLVDKMERQIVRFKERLRDHRAGKGGSLGSKEGKPKDDEDSYDDIIDRDLRGKE